MASRVASPDFVGRADELARLGAAVRAAAEGEPAVVLVGGESGVGKTRLVAELAARASADGALVLAGDCVDLGDGEIAYAPLVGALRGVDAGALEGVLGANVRALAPLLPQLDGAAGPAAPDQGRLFELLLALLAGLAEERPLVLVVEDLHWADRSTRDFLAFLIRNARRERLVVVATFRTDELHRRHPLRPFLAEADRAARVQRIALDRFTREELSDQLAGILGAPPGAQVVDELFARTEGNAFFTEELVAAGGDRLGTRLPDDVRDTLMLRIEALSPDAQRLLRTVAGAGPRVRHALLSRAAGMEEDALVAALREAVAAHVLVADPASDAYAFRHALLREAILDDLLPGERGPLHAAVGRALADDPALSASGRGVAAELAFHWYAAHDLPAAFAASAEAGAEAERVAAFAEANAHFERAAELWGAVPEERRAGGPSRVELLRRAADAAWLSGEEERAAALVRQALTLPGGDDPMTAAALHERLSRYQWGAGLSRDALETSSRAVALLPDDAPAPERARVLGNAAHLLMLVGRADEALVRAEEALALARAEGARSQEVRILNTLGGAQSMLGQLAEGIATMRAALAMAEELGDLEETSRAYVNLGEALDRAGELAESVAVARAGLDMAAREGLRGMAPLLTADLADRLLRLGRWDEAEAVLDARDGGPAMGVAGAAALVSRARLEALRGDAEAAERHLDEAEDKQRQAIGSMWTAPIAIARADAALWSGRPEVARAAVAAELVADVEGAHAIYLIPVMAAGVRAEADLAVRARATADAEAEAEALDRATRLVGDARDRLPAERPAESLLHVASAEAEAMRARGEDAAPAWAELAGRWAAFGAPFPAAYARWRQAEAVLAAAGARGDVAAVLGAAHAAAARLGAGPLTGEIEGLARRARIDLGAGPGADADAVDAAPSAAERVGLTARELDVLRLLATGSTNRQVAEQLFISQKTVSIHVSRILAKLDARTRVEAAGTAQRLGLLDP